MMKSMRRVLAMLLAVVMVVGLIPATVFAAETPLAAAIFASDVHEQNTSLTGSGTSAWKAVLSAIGENGITYNTVGLVGDTFSDISASASSMTSATQTALGQNAEVYYAWGNHDENVSDISSESGLQYSGSHYYIYHISAVDIRSKDGATSSSVETATSAFKTAVASMDKTKVLFIMSHIPLHDRREDNTYANEWYTAISEVAANMDVVFFWAHNHTDEDSVDQAAYYVASSQNGGTETMTIYNGSTVIPNFTYMNAGYIYAAGQNPKRKGVATTVEIYADSMVFQDYNSSGEYTDSSYSHNVTVARKHAATKTLTAIDVTGTTEYTVGGNGLNLTVTATYDDGTTADVTEDATFEPAELTASGVYTVAASYGGMTDTIDVTVKLYDEVLAADGETLLMGVEAFSQGATALEVTWDDDAAKILDTKGLYTDYVVYDLAVTNPGETTTYSMTLSESMDTTNLAVYHVADDGTLTLVQHTIENDCVVFTTSLTGAFAYGSITVPEGYTAASVTVENIPANMFVGDSLDMTDAVITVIYTKTDAEDFVRKLTVYDYEIEDVLTFVDNGNIRTYTFTFDGVSDTFNVSVWGKKFESGDVAVALDAEGSEYGVTGINITTPSDNKNVATAIQYVITGDNYVAYDITLAYADGYSATQDTKTVTLPIPEGVTNPVVYYVSANGTVVTDMNATNNGDGTVTFTTDHFSTYVVGESTQITVPENETATGSDTVTTTDKKTIYKLVSSLTAGEEYLIVSRNTAGSGYGLAGSTTGQSVTVKAADDISSVVYIEDKGNALEWTASSGWNFSSDNYDLGISQSSGSRSLSFSTSSDWTFNNNQLYARSGDRSYYLACSDGTWAVSRQNTSSRYAYFYQKTDVEVETSTTVSGTYSIDGEDETVAAVKGTTVDLTSNLVFTPTSGDATTTDVSTTATYEVYDADTTDSVKTGDPLGVISGIEGNVVTLSGNTGKALVKVTYTTDFGVVTDYITVTATTPDHYDIQLHKAEMTKVSITEFTEGVTYYTFDSVTNTYHEATEYVAGTTYYTTPVIKGDEITATVALKGIEAGDTYAVWAVVKAYASADDTTGADMGALGSALTWSVSDTSIATIDPTTGVITFTGTNYGDFTVTVAYEGADGKVITDTITISVTKTLYVVPEDGTDDFPEYPNEGAVRFDKTATAVGNYSETGLALVELSMTGVPYSTGSAIDVLLMLDMSTSMDASVGTDDDGNTITRKDITVAAANAFVETIVKNSDGTFNANKVAVGYFNGSSVTYVTGTSSAPYISISDATTLTTVKSNITAIADKSLTANGTYYNAALEDAYSKITAQDAASENTQAFVFMSDGGPTGYTYVDGTSSGEIEKDGAGTIVGWFTTSDNGTTDDETDDTATPTNNFKTEYYTAQMKAKEYTIYTVGLGLSSNDDGPQEYKALTSGAHESLTSYILTQMATSASHFYNVADSDAVANMGNIFSGIAASIKEAATNVVVEDKIGSKYSMNFSLPGYGTANQLDTTALDGVSEFYIQVVDYVLDTTTHERTGVYTVLENFTFNFDGSLKSHTVDGVACGDTCSHVTTDDDSGAITAIDGTYFDYKSDSTGEYLTWTAEKLTSTELALQYFAHLDNSTGVAEENQVPAGTYYTNEYATLTYDNVNGNRVQQEFPVPQLTWYGAQVSYVFYLVNEAGQPVNRAGRVVPFAEAVYVTDVYTEAVVWNDLEQSAGLDAERLAADLVPEVYALYDDDASYNIHVYADEDGVNLNNHFVIGGDVKDTDYNVTDDRSWTNATTTYVFNNKSDGTKYNTVGAYVADDGDTTANETGLTYLCKGANAVTDLAWTQVTLNSDSDLVNGAYYYDVNGVKTRALTYVAGTTYYQLTGASYTVASGETQWKPGEGDSTTGGTEIGGYVYYVDEKGVVYTIVQKTNGTEVREGFDFANTTVAFAVVWKPQLKEDVVVIDYGLDVVIDVIANDAMAAGVKEVQTTQPDATINSGFYTRSEELTTSADLSIGTATVENLTSVRFSLNKTNGMQFNEPAVFYYEADVNYYTYDASNNATLNTTSMYSSVTVIPATTVYYEDNFVTFTNSSSADGTYGTWSVDGTAANKTQDVDRPGTKTISAAYDANNVYGYDSAYESMSTYSMGAAHKVTVASGKSGMASFDFYGTGFDVISMTDNKSGMIIVNVYPYGSTTAVKSFTVNNYYGYAYENGEWVTVDSDDSNALYQVPVMKVTGLDYGKYTAKIVANYNSLSDVTGAGQYDFYLDAIRIYDPCGSNTEANEVYDTDGEYNPVYTELRNLIIDSKTFNSLGGTTVSGIVFIDGSATDSDGVSIDDYTSYGPNNELYLEAGQAVAGVLSMTGAKAVQLAIKTVGGTGSVEVYGVKTDGTKVECLAESISTATDMYYDITALNGLTLVVKNAAATDATTDNAIISITNIKSTYAADSGVATASLEINEESAGIALMSLRPTVVEEETTEPETEATEPETEATEPETEATEPETEATEPEVQETVPEETVPEENEPEVEEDATESITDTIKNFFNKISNAISNLFGRWFR